MREGPPMGVRMKAHNNSGFLLRFVMPGVNRLATPLGIDNTEIGISLQGFPFEKKASTMS